MRPNGTLVPNSFSKERLRANPFMKKILVIDDNILNLISTKEVLESWGYNVTTESSALNGIDLAFASQYDLILVDYIMPDLNGDAVILKIKKQKPNQKIVFYSCDIECNLQNVNLSSIADGFIDKDVDMTQFKHSIMYYLGV